MSLFMKNNVDKTRKLIDLMSEGSDSNVLADDPLIKVLNAKLKELGYSKKVKVAEDRLKKISTEKVDLSKLGIAGAIFDTMDCEVWVGGDSDYRMVTIEIRVQWKHPAGRNGYTHRLNYYESKGDWRL